MTKKLNFGVIGAGSRAHSLVRTAMQDKRIDLVALCDIHPGALEEYNGICKRELGHEAKTYTDFYEFLDHPDLDAVIVSTPDYLHHNMAVETLKADKHLFLEKPVGLNLEQMHDIVTHAVKSDKILEIGYVLRYAPFFVKMKELIETGKIGRPLFVQALEEYYGAFHFNRGWWRKKANTGGIMVQKICHDMDLHYWMFGEPEKIVAFDGINEFKPGSWDSDAKYCSECKNHCPYFVTKQSRTRSDECVFNSDHDVADNAQVLIQFKNGVNLSMGMNFFNSLAQDDRHWRVVGSKAEITGRLAHGIIRYDPRFSGGETGSTYLETNVKALTGHGGGDSVQMIEFINGIFENREAKAGIESAYWSSIMVMGAQISADTEKVVKVPDLTKKYPLPKRE